MKASLNFYNDFWLGFWYHSSKFSQRGIGGSSCHTCEGEEVLSPWVKIRGLCKKSVFDRRYRFGDDNIQGIYLQGERGTNITVAKIHGLKYVQFAMIHTALESNMTIKVYHAETTSPFGKFLLGKRRLRISEDDGCESSQSNYTLDVIFSTCFDDEFTCDDGSCINMTKRCDNIRNCPYDISDETECTLLVIPPSYEKTYAPTGVDKNGDVIKVNVTVSVDVTNILRLSETQDIFETKLNLHLTWIDNRLQFNNLKLKKKNMIVRNQQEKLWIPPVFFENTKDSETIVNDGRAKAYVMRYGHFKLVGNDVLYNTEVFNGDENTITVFRIYRHEFICIYQIAWYPFDTQRCRVVLSPEGNSDEFINLLPGNLTYLGPEDLTIYFIKHIAIHGGVSMDKKVVYVEVTLGRRLLSTVLTVYLPTLLLNIIGFSTNFFKVSVLSVYYTHRYFRVC